VSTPKPNRFVRQFALTQGRARSIGTDLPLDTQVQTTLSGRNRERELVAESAAILRMCRTPISIAEISAHLHVHLGVARVLVSDLAATGDVAVTTADHDENGPDLLTLERLLDDLQAL